MKEICEYEVRGEDNKLFCMCSNDENDRKILTGAGGHRISFESLQQQVFNPAPSKGRGQKRKQSRMRKIS